MDIKYKLLIILLAFSISPSLFATVTIPIKIEELIEKSEFIGKVKILTGGLSIVNTGDENVDCGYRFSGEVSDALKGERTRVTFLSGAGLQLGQEYLVFLSRTDSVGSKIVSTNSTQLDDLVKNEQHREICDSSTELLKSINGTNTRFSSQRRIKINDRFTYEPWIDYIGSIAQFYREEVRIAAFSPLNVRVSTNDNSIVELDYEDMVTASIEGEQPEYPFVLLDKILMNWSDVRTLLMRLINENN